MQFKPYDLKQAKDGDLVMLRPPAIQMVGEVFVGKDRVVIRWSDGYLGIFNKGEEDVDHRLVHKPVFMLNGEPVYTGYTIYNLDGEPVVIGEDLNPLKMPGDLDPKHWSFKPRPKTLNINGHEVPWPETKKPECGQKYWLVDLYAVRQDGWDGMDLELVWLKNGHIHLSKENAEKHRVALLSFFKQD